MNWEEAACLDFAANYHERMFLRAGILRVTITVLTFAEICQACIIV